MSRIFVDRISPFQSGSITIDGFQPDIDTGSFATTGSNTFEGNQTINGSAVQNFTAPAQNNEVQFVNVSGANIGGRNYDRVASSFSNFGGIGLPFENYFGIEYFDSFGYNFGSEFNINGKQIQITTSASGSGQQSFIRTTDNYDGTSQVSIFSGNKIQITGKTELSNVLQLAPIDPLPANGVGQLAVSGSDLYYNDGNNWVQLN